MSEPTSQDESTESQESPTDAPVLPAGVEDWSVDLDDDDLDYEHPDDYSKQRARPTARPSRVIVIVVVGLAVLAGAVIFGRSSSPGTSAASSPMCVNYAKYIAASVKITQIQAKEPTSGPTAAQAKSITAIFNTEPAYLQGAASDATAPVAKKFGALILSLRALVRAPSSTSASRRATLDSNEQAALQAVITSANKICYGS
jgi:hypothetical protein